MYLQKNRKLHEFATTNNFFLKSTLSDMHHRKTYMYINFQQNRVSKSVKTVHTSLFAKFANSINLQLAIRISKNHAFRTCTTPLRTFMLILRSIGLLNIEILQTDGQTDGQTSRTTTIGIFFEKNILKTTTFIHCLLSLLIAIVERYASHEYVYENIDHIFL